MTVTRFAPSPTGDLHVGSARTALYAYLFAKHANGDFILRIEDTDRERSTQAAVDVILDGLSWLGLTWDQGPVYQSERMPRYLALIEQLIDAGHAYRCYLTIDELDAMRESQIKQGERPRYNHHSRELNLPDTGKPHVVRFKNPLTGSVSFEDQVLGEITINNEELDDFIILRSDGMPTYNFAVVVDDADMNITHVIRGNDHLNNTVRQINCYLALGLTPPSFAHIPMIAGEDGKKLSKRHGAISVLQYRQDGYLPAALLNYLVRLGWSHGDQEIFSHQDMIDSFNLGSVSKSAAIFDHEKLNWLNQHYLKHSEWETVKAEVVWHYAQANIDISLGPGLDETFAAYKERVVTLTELIDKTRCYYQETVDLDPEASSVYLTESQRPVLEALHFALNEIEVWESAQLKPVVKSVVKDLGLKFPEVAQPLRVALTGNIMSPGIDQTLLLTGKNRGLARIKAALDYI